jgi:hypothetical protein
MVRMTDAYIDWSLSIAEEGLTASYELPEDAVMQEFRDVLVVDMFCMALWLAFHSIDAILSCFLSVAATHQPLALIEGDSFVASACIRHGWMPVAPYFPTVVITLRALEVYRVTHLRCPRLGIQAFVRALCDIHGVAPRPWLRAQFSVAFDVYLAIRAAVDTRVQAALGRDTPNWCLKNACPACLYKVEGEAPLELPLLATMDGNNSLARFELREKEVLFDDGSVAPGASKEQEDHRTALGDYYLSREEVNEWGKEGMEDIMKGFVPNDEDDDGCTERWQNMKESVTTRSWGMYDETGIFPALCRHGFVLVIVDMIKSGEL